VSHTKLTLRKKEKSGRWQGQRSKKSRPARPGRMDHETEGRGPEVRAWENHDAGKDWGIRGPNSEPYPRARREQRGGSNKEGGGKGALEGRSTCLLKPFRKNRPRGRGRGCGGERGGDEPEDWHPSPDPLVLRLPKKSL